MHVQNEGTAISTKRIHGDFRDSFSDIHLEKCLANVIISTNVAVCRKTCLWSILCKQTPFPATKGNIAKDMIEIFAFFNVPVNIEGWYVSSGVPVGMKHPYK